MTKYLINGLTLRETDPSLNRALAVAYQQKQKSLCLCKTPGIPMYIAKHGAKGDYVIKRMPNSGRDHHFNCASYEPPAELSGRGALNDAISEDPTTGVMSLKVDFSLLKTSMNRPPVEGGAAESSVVKSEPSKLTLKSTFDCLYDKAGLNKWSPKMEGKRGWYVVRKHLWQAARNIVVKKYPLSSILLMPEPFSMERIEEMSDRRHLFFSKLKPMEGKSPIGVLIGEVKAFEDAAHGKKLVIKHMRDTPLYYGKDVDRGIRKNFGREMAMHAEDERIHLLTIATFSMSTSGNLAIESIYLMTVDRHWLPFDNLDELYAIDKAVKDQRHFIKGMRYGLNADDVMATILLTDTQDRPTCVYLVPPGASDAYRSKLDLVIKESQFGSCLWDLNEESPLLLPEIKKQVLDGVC